MDIKAPHGISSSPGPRPAGAQSGSSVPSVERETSQGGGAAAPADRLETPTSDFVKSAVARLNASASDRLEGIRARIRNGSLPALDDPARSEAAADGIVAHCGRKGR